MAIDTSEINDFLAKETEVMRLIYLRTVDGERLRDIAKAWAIPYGKLAGWIAADAERARIYDEALKHRAHDLIEETLQIVDDENIDVQRAKLRADQRTKIATFWDKKRYGPKNPLDDVIKGGGSIHVITGIPNSPESVSGDAAD